MSRHAAGVPPGRPGRRNDERYWTLFSASLSPFALKVAALLDAHALAYRWVPSEAGFVESLRARARVSRVTSGAAPLTWPPRNPLDEFPLVPYLFGPDGENLYDSSSIAEWLDLHRDKLGSAAAPTVLTEDPALELAIRLIDEYADEFGLYMVHHNRWVLAARDNGAGERLAEEFTPLLGPLAALVRKSFPPRQVRRLPYLMSVADPADRSFDDLPPSLRPPPRPGFPPTHGLLDERFAALLTVLDELLSRRPYVFGDRFTLADASLYGQLQMNVTDASAEALIGSTAPRLRAWMTRIERGEIAASGGELRLDEALRPLFAEVCSVFVPLMQQNHDAYERHRSRGATAFNEGAFDRGEALYDGTLTGHAFRSVAKTFQVRVWRDLRRAYDRLDEDARGRLGGLLPNQHGLDRDGAI